jgi:cell wall-associated NlpC family hydrolase
MPTSREARVARLRPLVVLLLCAGLASASLFAAGGARHRSKPDVSARVVSAARTHLGQTYQWGAEGPKAFDCSGLTSMLWSSAGGVRAIPRTAALQQAWAVPLPEQQAIHGDLAFFGEPVTHVGLIVGRTRSGLRMIDASSSQGGVVERDVWHSGVVRFGRVPRKGMLAVTPWHSTTPTGGPLVRPGAPGLVPGKQPLSGLPRPQAHPSSNAMRRYVVLAKKQIGARTWTDTALAAELWKRAGGRAVHTDRPSLQRATTRVLLRDARVGDLVVYAAPASHVGIYIGGGYMVDASKLLGKVVARPVWAGQGVTLRRWRA